MIPAGMEMFACVEGEGVVDMAKSYIRYHGLNSDNVALVKSDNLILVRAKVPVELNEGSFAEHWETENG